MPLSVVSPRPLLPLLSSRFVVVLFRSNGVVFPPVSSLPEKQSPRDRASIVEISSTTRQQRSRSNGERNDTGSRDREAIGIDELTNVAFVAHVQLDQKKKNEADLRPASRTTFAMTTLVDDARYDTMVIDVSCDEDETKVIGTTDGTMVSN